MASDDPHALLPREAAHVGPRPSTRLLREHTQWVAPPLLAHGRIPRFPYVLAVFLRTSRSFLHRQVAAPAEAANAHEHEQETEKLLESVEYASPYDAVGRYVGMVGGSFIRECQSFVS